MIDTAPVNACMKHICNISSPEVGQNRGSTGCDDIMIKIVVNIKLTSYAKHGKVNIVKNIHGSDAL